MMNKGCDSLIDQKKIILMTKLEMYNKKYGNEDQKRCKYFLEDYIYIKNLKTRVCFTLVVLFFLAMGTTKIITSNLIIPESLDQFMSTYINPYILPWLIGIVVYTVISSLVYGKQYRDSQERLRAYHKILKELDDYERGKEEALNENN